MIKVKTILKKIEDMSGVAIIAKYEIEEAIAELEEFEKECKKLIIESKKLVNETLNLSDINIKQQKRILELEAQKANSCRSCKNWGDEDDDINESPRFCFKGISQGYTTSITDNDFFCKYYSPKEQL